MEKKIYRNPMWLDDVLSGKTKIPRHKDFGSLEVYKYAWECYDGIHEEKKDGFGVFFKRDFKSSIVPNSPMLVESTKEILMKDAILSNFIMMSKEWHTSTHKKRYYVSRPLSETFNDADLDLTSEHFPIKFTGYFEFNFPVFEKEGCELIGCYVSTFVAEYDVKKIKKGERAIRISGVFWSEKEKGFMVSMLFLGLKPNKCIKEAISEETYLYQDDVVYNRVVESSYGEYEHYLHMVLSSVAYINGGNHELNDIVEKSVPENNRYFEKENVPTKIPSPRPFILLGRNFNYAWVKEKGIVRGHWKTQPHGPMNSLRKLIFRDDFLTTVKKKVKKLK